MPQNLALAPSDSANVAIGFQSGVNTRETLSKTLNCAASVEIIQHSLERSV